MSLNPLNTESLLKLTEDRRSVDEAVSLNPLNTESLLKP